MQPVLLLAHANGFHGRVFDPMVDGGLRDHFRCVTFDFRGHGDSPRAGVIVDDWWRFGDDVAEVVDAIDDRPLFGFGHSMGGAALLMTELNAPGTFRALFAYEPIVPPTTPAPLPRVGDNAMVDAALRRREVFDSSDAAIFNYSSKPPLNVFTPAAMRAYVEHGFAPQPDGSVRIKCRGETEASIYRTAGDHHVFDRLGEVRCPVTVAIGADLGIGPAAFGPLVVERLPQGRLVRFDDLDHFGPMAAPEKLADAVAATLLVDD